MGRKHPVDKKRPIGERIVAGVSIALVPAFLLWLILSFLLPNLHRPTVSEGYAQAADAAVYTADTVGGEEVRYVSDNVEAMELRLAMIASAQEEIVLSTFDFDTDEAGLQLLAALLDAAQRGVTVRVVVDGLSGFLDVYASPCFQALAAHENAEIKIYDPVTILQPWKDMYRLHDKYLIVDGACYLLGGRNSNTLFLGDYEGQNIDSEVYVLRREARDGDSMEQLLAYFETVWACDACQEVAVTDAAAAAKKAEELGEIYAQLPELYPAAYETGYLESVETLPANKVTLLSGSVEAENKAPEVWYALLSLMAEGDDILIHTPYVVLSDDMMDDLAQVASDASSFVLILNDVSSGANPFGCVDYLNNKEELLAAGITVGEFLRSGESLHTKNVLIDDRICIVGSFNLDMRSAYLDTELMLVIDSEALNAQLRALAEEELEECRLVSPDGTESLGAQFTAQELTGGKRIFYAVLRQVIRPFRCLL